jgi:hypothetical protein
VAADFSGKDMQRRITMPEFLSLAWNAANDKARELKSMVFPVGLGLTRPREDATLWRMVLYW